MGEGRWLLDAPTVRPASRLALAFLLVTFALGLLVDVKVFLL